MNTKHTLGPWHIGMHPGPIIYGADSSQVADCRGDLLAECERLRAINAQLRVSLEWAIGHIDGSPSLSHKACLTAIRAVVDRAKGPQS